MKKLTPYRIKNLLKAAINEIVSLGNYDRKEREENKALRGTGLDIHCKISDDRSEASKEASE